MNQAMEMFSIAGRINSAASCAKEAAEKFEQDYNYEDASKFYLSASELYEADNTPTTANSMLNKWCECMILMEKFDEKNMISMIRAYEKIGTKFL